MGLPPWLVGWIVPVRESFSLLPQAALSVYLRNYSKRYWVWRMGMCVQLLCTIGLIGMCWYAMHGHTQIHAFLFALLFLATIAIYSIGRACSSLTVKDIQADVVEKGRRGSLIGNTTMLSGVLSIVIALPIAIYPVFQEQNSLLLLALLSALMVGTAIFLMWPIRTEVMPDVEQDKKGPALQNLLPQLSKKARRFILVRAIFTHSALVAPFFMLSQSSVAERLALYYLVAEALAALVAARLWGKLSDKSARSTLRLSGGMAVSACVGLLLLQPDELWLSIGLFFLLSIAHTGVRNGRKTYTLDIEEGQSRTELVGSANTIIGLVLLIVGAVYAALQPWLGEGVVVIMTAMLTLGVAMTFTLAKEKD